MTYRSEPLSNRHNRVPDDMSKSADTASGMSMSTIHSEDSNTSTKAGQ